MSRVPEKPYVLLVDDEQEIAEVYTMILEAEGFRVVQAHDGADALRVLGSEHGRPALIVTDLSMPRMSGYELCRRVEAIPELADVPVIVLSAVVDLDRLPRTDIIKHAFRKPVTLDELIGCVERWGGAARRGSPAVRLASA